MVWGSVEGRVAAVAPKVFKLTGMSAEEVRGLASAVSQDSGGDGDGGACRDESVGAIVITCMHRVCINVSMSIS